MKQSQESSGVQRMNTEVGEDYTETAGFRSFYSGLLESDGIGNKAIIVERKWGGVLKMSAFLIKGLFWSLLFL